MAVFDNLISYWKLDESSGNAADQVTTNTLTNTGVTYTTGKINNGADFERADTTDTLSIADASQTGLDVTSPFTISCWVKFESTPGSGEIWSFVSKMTGFDDNYSFMFGYREDGATDGIFLGETSDGSNSSSGVSGLVAWAPSNGTWYHVAVVFDGSLTGANRVRFYIDGTGSYSATSGWHAAVFSGSAAFRVGNSGNGNPFDGMIDELGIWSRALSDAEITELYNSGNGLTYPQIQNLVMAADVGAFILTGIDAGVGRVLTLITEVGSFILTGIDVILSKTGWTNATKNSSSWSNSSKNASTFSNQSKNSTSWSNRAKQ